MASAWWMREELIGLKTVHYESHFLPSTAMFMN